LQGKAGIGNILKGEKRLRQVLDCALRLPVPELNHHVMPISSPLQSVNREIQRTATNAQFGGNTCRFAVGLMIALLVLVVSVPARRRIRNAVIIAGQRIPLRGSDGGQPRAQESRASRGPVALRGDAHIPPRLQRIPRRPAGRNDRRSHLRQAGYAA
jgi:hypothetical protein